MNDVFYMQQRMPYRIKAFVMEDPEGDYTVVVNDYLSEEALRRVLLHEDAHISYNHLQSCENAATIEAKMKEENFEQY